MYEPNLVSTAFTILPAHFSTAHKDMGLVGCIHSILNKAGSDSKGYFRFEEQGENYYVIYEYLDPHSYDYWSSLNEM